MQIRHLVFKSLYNRRLATILTIFSIALSVMLFTGIERVRRAARESFASTISQTDLIVGAKGGTIQLLLYSVFRMGQATNNLTYETFEKLSQHPEVAWTVPISLGDSHKGFRVVATNENFYKHYQYHYDRHLSWREGKAPNEVFDVALGSAVADNLGYKIGDKIALAHGISDVTLQGHADKPFTVVGVLANTATPVDRSVYITLEGMEAIHIDWQDGAPPVPGQEVKPQTIKKEQIKVSQITAFLLGAKTRIATLRLQREFNDYGQEPIMAIIPAEVLAELWDGLSYAEIGLQVVALMVIVVGLLGMLIAIFLSLNERRREMAIFRSLGATPGVIFSLLMWEALVLTVVGAILGVGVMYAALFAVQPWLADAFGLYVPIELLSSTECLFLGGTLALALLLGAIPAWRAYRQTLADGLTIRI